MKTLIRSGERRAFRATAGRAGPSVADMIDSVLDRLSRHAIRLRLISEISVGVLFSFTAAYYATSVTSNYLVGVLLLPLGAGIALHRIRPLWGLIISAAPIVVVSLAGWSGGTPNGALWFPIYIAVFGAVAYGSDQVRWLGRAFALALTVAFIAGGIGYVGYGLGPLSLLVLLMPALAWFGGELLRSARARRTLTTEVEQTATQRDAALTRADLEAERTRVARDVHDVVAHSLTVVIAQADGARYATAQRDEQAADAFETIAQTARDALADVRVLLTGLRHTQEDGPQPGVDDLGALLDSMREAGLTLAVREFGTRGHLSETRALALYRILQEALTNALRHGARDEPTVVELEWGADAVDLVVTNAAPASAAAEHAEPADPPHRGHGIDGMRERATLAGGVLSVHEGETFRVRLRLPLEPSPEPAEPGEVTRSADVSQSAEVSA